MRYNDIQWEDEDSGFPDDKMKKANEDVSFEDLLAQDKEEDELDLRVGKQVTGRISRISASTDTVLVEIDALHTAVMDKNQITDEKGDLQYHEGDSIKVYVSANTADELL